MPKEVAKLPFSSRYLFIAVHKRDASVSIHRSFIRMESGCNQSHSGKVVGDSINVFPSEVQTVSLPTLVRVPISSDECLYSVFDVDSSGRLRCHERNHRTLICGQFAGESDERRNAMLLHFPAQEVRLRTAVGANIKLRLQGTAAAIGCLTRQDIPALVESF